MKILCVLGRHNYGQESRGTGYEYRHFLSALQNLGHDVSFFDSWDRSIHTDFAALNRSLLETVRRQEPDIVFCVLMHYEIWTETLDLIRTAFPVRVLNWGTDDSWKYDQFAQYIAPHVDLYATTYASAITMARRQGIANFHRTQWAADSGKLLAPLSARDCRYRVSFVGSAYGNRRKWIGVLQSRGVEVQCFGHGWKGGVLGDEQLSNVIRQSVISLNFADSPAQLSRSRYRYNRQLKARTFEVPGSGGFLLTETADGIEDYYVPGREIATFEGMESLVDLIRHYLQNPDERDEIANAGFRRTAEEHVYEKRFAELLAALPSRSACCREPITPDEVAARFDAIAQRHRPSRLTRLVRWLIIVPCVLLWGRQRGPRAARRALFEVSWRLAGRRTYSAAGWPGRMFYRQS